MLCNAMLVTAPRDRYLHERSGSVALPRTKEVPAREETRGFTEAARRAARTVEVVRNSEVAIVSFVLYSTQLQIYELKIMLRILNKFVGNGKR